MNLRLTNLNECPPGGFDYQIPELNNKPVGPTIVFRDLMAAVLKQYELARVLPPGDLEQKIHTYICKRLDPSLCSHADGLPQLSNTSTAAVKFFSVVQGTLTLAEWFVQGRILGKVSLVTQEQANTRAVTCTTCPHNVPVGRCAPCVAGHLAKAVQRVVGNVTTPHDARLLACDLCGCSLRAKIWLPLDLLRKHMREEQLASFPDFCWLVREAAIDPAAAKA